MSSKRRIQVIIIGLVVIYVLYTLILFKPPREGWDIILVKLTIWFIGTVLFIAVVAGYFALKD